jgi:hypothetical protein
MTFCCIFVQGHTLLERISGADAPTLAAAIAKHTALPSIVPHSRSDRAPEKPTDEDVIMGEAETQEELDERMRNIMKQSKVVLFMKGNPDAPRCGFSRKIVGMLKDQNIEFSHFDILTDEDVRQGQSLFCLSEL